MFEIWKDITGFEGLYQASNTGRVKSLLRSVSNGKGTRVVKERILKPQKIKNGYLKVALRTDGKTFDRYIHRVIAETFLSNPKNLSQINHKDEVKDNNHVSNLEWCNSDYNMTYGNAQRGNHARKKAVLQYSLEGEFIAEHESINDAGRAIHRNAQNIHNNCTGKQKTAYGYVFSFKPEEVIE